MIKERRRAIHATLVRESKDNPGYYRYTITIKEKDGTVHDVPAYGKDMQDAIERLLWVERVGKVTNKKLTTPILVILWLNTIIVPGVISAQTNNPWWIVGAILFSVGLAFITSGISKYLDNKN
jgi:hypothetical protein